MLSTRFRGVDLARGKTPPMLCGALTRKVAPLRLTVSPVDSEEDKCRQPRVGGRAGGKMAGGMLSPTAKPGEGGGIRGKRNISPLNEQRLPR
ncbi:hypothetical protein JIQ42_02097 [Leishmania sp. Namibia]|uniref:hypothetical protein n=1 Tax=Leishmania sp. Namibia TaxID=2802991 RepID=UPI001B512201|nr:hypothetical protein JIQ42_02097 [Leishmania sp. Namibia]